MCSFDAPPHSFQVPENTKVILVQSTGFSREEYWSGLPFSSLRDLPNPGIDPGSPALQADSLPSEPPREHHYWINKCCFLLLFLSSSFNTLKLSLIPFLKISLVGGKLLYSVVLVSAVQQHELVKIIYIPSLVSLPNPIHRPILPLQAITERHLGSLCYIAAFHQLSISHVIVDPNFESVASF